ncbi:MAG: hypothetical protein Q7T45_04830 [Bradyrhizobium sp.]|uniref:hypothetical protein n=1 Tax=Bradyrhizobium sp. TaxID=376 RepID=UPI002716CCBE|nr:hypothetical protein [Bradyrhizobium sp.]MDO8397124.1 hypothetical protein [Bradyrhizobium sp.]
MVAAAAGDVQRIGWNWGNAGKEKIILAVFNSLDAVPSRLAVNDSYPIEWEASLKRTLALK